MCLSDDFRMPYYKCKVGWMLVKHYTCSQTKSVQIMHVLCNYYKPWPCSRQIILIACMFAKYHVNAYDLKLHCSVCVYVSHVNAYGS